MAIIKWALEIKRLLFNIYDNVFRIQSPHEYFYGNKIRISGKFNYKRC